MNTLPLVLLFCGLPGSGKSTFIQHFRQYLENQIERNDHSQILSYDVIGEEIEWNANSYHLIREKGHQKLLELIEVSNELTNTVNTTESIRKDRFWILLDDTMHMRSMRREIYVVCRDYRVPLFTVWIDCDLNIAKARLSQRNQLHFQKAVDDASFERIVDQFQPPNPTFIFDRYFLRIDSNTEPFEESMSLLYRTVIQYLSIWKPYFPDTKTGRSTNCSKSSNSSNTSILQFLDDDFRKIVSFHMNEWKRIVGADYSKVSLYTKNLARLLQKVKLDHFNQIRIELEDVSPKDLDALADLRELYCKEFRSMILYQMRLLLTDHGTDDLPILYWSTFIDQLIKDC